MCGLHQLLEVFAETWGWYKATYKTRTTIKVVPGKFRGKNLVTKKTSTINDHQVWIGNQCMLKLI
jgi:hypothetical protein